MTKLKSVWFYIVLYGNCFIKAIAIRDLMAYCIVSIVTANELLHVVLNAF